MGKESQESAPFLILPEQTHLLSVLRLPAVVGGAAAGAIELSSQQIGVIANALSVLYVIAAAAENGIGLVPQLLGDNSGHDLTRLVFEHDPFLRWEEFLLFGEHIHHLDLVSYIVALVFWIGDHIGHGGVGDFLAVEVAVALLPKDGFDLFHAVLIGGVQFEQLPYHRCLFLVNDQPAVFLAIAENAAVSQHHVILDGLLMAEFYAAAELAQLVLGNGGHNGQPQFGVLIEGVDIVVLEEHAHAVAKELPRELDGVQRVAGKISLVMIRSNLSSAASSTMRLKFSRCLVEMPDKPSSI